MPEPIRLRNPQIMSRIIRLIGSNDPYGIIPLSDTVVPFLIFLFPPLPKTYLCGRSKTKSNGKV